MTRMFVGLTIVAIALSGAAGLDEQGAVLLRSLIQSNNDVHTYSYAYKGKKRFLVNRQKSLENPQVSPRYEEYDYTLDEAYDNGKTAFEVHRPRVISGKGIVPGETDNVRQVYDGELVTQNERPNHYILSRTPAQHRGLMTPMRFRDTVLSLIGEGLDKGTVSLTSEPDGACVLLHVDLPGKEPGARTRNVTIKVNREQGNRVEEISASGATAVFTDFRDAGGGIMIPLSGEYMLTAGGILVEKNEMTIAELHVNETMDPERFRMEIPEGASVFHEDLGMQIDITNATGAVMNKFAEQTFLAAAEKQNKDVAGAVVDQAAVHDQKEGSPKELQDGPAKNGDESPTSLAKVIVGVVIAVALLAGVALIRAQWNKRRVQVDR